MNNDDLIIIKTDGGICSQIAFLSLGLYFERRGCKVKYDMSFFEENGLGVDGKSIRNYELCFLFPKLKIEKASQTEIIEYKSKYYYQNPICVSNICSPAYIDGYPRERETSLFFNRDLFINYMNPVINCRDDILLKEIILNSVCCGVHCRRGDIAANSVVAGYGLPTPTQYFVSAISYIKKIAGNINFVFFSDEPEWVSKELIPLLKDTKCHVVTNHGQDKGYIDLFLMSLCKYMIGSNGSMSLMAKLLSNNLDSLLILCKPIPWICEQFDNIVIFNQKECIPLNTLTEVVPVGRYLSDKEQAKRDFKELLDLAISYKTIRFKACLYKFISFVCPIKFFKCKKYKYLKRITNFRIWKNNLLN